MTYEFLAVNILNVNKFSFTFFDIEIKKFLCKNDWDGECVKGHIPCSQNDRVIDNTQPGKKTSHLWQ